MPELPEVETVKRGLAQSIVGSTITDVVVRERRLRWPIEQNLPQCLTHNKVLSVERRAKYVIVVLKHGCLLIHLGMSGSCHIVKSETPLKKHDHVDIVFKDFILRYHDPRRFGAMLWTDLAFADMNEHPRLQHLGPEPLARQFNATYLWQIAKKRNIALKSLIMDQSVVVGVGNIYACEALFAAGIHPKLMANQLSMSQARALVIEIKQVLRQAIKLGGTTLRDFSSSRGKPGYFKQKLQVYGRAGEACFHCDTPINAQVISGRNSFYCDKCQLPVAS